MIPVNELGPKVVVYTPFSYYAVIIHITLGSSFFLIKKRYERLY